MTVALLPPLWAAGQEPLAVHFTPGVAHPVTREEDKRLENVFRAAQKTVQELETSLKKQHGKNQDGWPEAPREELRAARDASAQAQTDWLYSSVTQKDIDDSVHDLTEKLGEKKTLRLAPSAAEADLELLVIGRGKVIRDLGWGGAEAAAEVAMRVAPGGRLSSDTLTQSGASFRAKKSLMSRGGAFTIHDFSKDAPYWLLVSRKPIVGFSFPWKGAAGQAIDAFERFSAENADKLTAARSARK